MEEEKDETEKKLNQYLIHLVSLFTYAPLLKTIKKKNNKNDKKKS